jgi:hypothetical protein
MKAWYSSSFDWKTSQLAIGEIPSEPLIATINKRSILIGVNSPAAAFGCGLPISVISEN